MKARLIVTHRHPHLDEIGGMWLLRRFGGEAKTRVKFIAQGKEEVVRALEKSFEVIALGVGLGKFDEHRGVKNKSSCLLVWEDLQRRTTLAELEQRAVGKIVNWINAEDTAQIGPVPFKEFGISTVLDGYYLSHSKSSAALVKLGLTLLDSLFARLQRFVEAEQDWVGRIEFESRWGKAVAVESEKHDLSTIAYRQGFVLVVAVDPAKGYRYIGAPGNSKVDLTPVYERLLVKEPGTQWYLHHGKKMLLSGSDIVDNQRLSTLSLQQLINIITEG